MAPLLQLRNKEPYKESADLLVVEVDPQGLPYEGSSKNAWIRAGTELFDHSRTWALPLPEGSLEITSSFKLKRFTYIAHMVIPKISNPALSIGDRANLKNCYQTLFEKARELGLKNMVFSVLPILGRDSFGVSIHDAVEVALFTAYQAVTNGELETVKEILFTTKNKVEYHAMQSHSFYKDRKEWKNEKVKDTGMKECSIQKFRPGMWQCRGNHVSLTSLIGAKKSDDRTADLLGCENEADLIMCRNGKFDIDWNSDEAAKLEICDRHVKVFLFDWRNPSWKNFKVRDGTPLCTFPDHQGPPPTVGRNHRQLVTKDDCKRWAAKKKTVLKVGTPICDQDMALLRGPEFDPEQSQKDVYLNESLGKTIEPRQSVAPYRVKTESVVPPGVDEAVKKLFSALECRNVNRRKNWMGLGARQLREKARIVRIAIKAIYDVIAPGGQEELRDRVNNGGRKKIQDPYEQIKKHLADVADLYSRSDSKLHRLFILSSVAKFPLPMLQEFFHGLTVDRMYLAWLEEEGLSHMALKETTAKYIIKLVAPSRRRNLTCVDEKIADGMKAFDELFAAAFELGKKGIIDKDIETKLIKDLQSAKSYLRGDFKVHVKDESHCADHCATFALSDPDSACFSSDCGHSHDNICERCSELDSTLKFVEELLEHAKENAETPAEEELFSILKEECEINCAYIYEMKKHQIRAALSHQEKAQYVESLLAGQALVTLDWAQKLTPFYAREKQVEYYAKAGICYHICHAETKIGNEPAEHLSIHIFEPGEKQDGTAVFLIVESFLKELKKMKINRVLIRSDCAGKFIKFETKSIQLYSGCYRNAPFIVALLKLSKKIGVRIDGLMFSEAQSGKGPCDRGSARAKGKARDIVTSTRGKIETKEEFFDALTTGKPLNGVSVHLCSISGKKAGNAKLKDITSYSSFQFENDKTIRLRRHRSIGTGLPWDHGRMTPCEGQLKIIRSGGHTTADPDLFWLTCKSHQERAPALAPSNPTVSNSRMLPCIEDSCIAEYRTYHQLARHISSEKHKYKLERKTMHDYCIKFASLSIGINPSTNQMNRALANSVHGAESELKQGWALRGTRKRNPEDQAARELVRQFFADKRKNNLKANPHEAETMIRNWKGKDGKKIAPKNRLTITQIKCLIRDLLKKEEKGKKSTVKKPKAASTPVNDSSDESDGEDSDNFENPDDLSDESDDEEELKKLVLSHKNTLYNDSDQDGRKRRSTDQ